jgi:16S rRNA (guanine527-N7)-methyltransferase
MERDDRELLAEGAAAFGLVLENSLLERFERYSLLLQRWGEKINLTTRLTSREIVTHHFLDSLTALPLLREAPPGILLDIGTGAGFPGIPLKICLPGLRLTLLESSRKKVSFCREIIRQLDLAPAVALHGRAEELAGEAGHREAYDWIALRAVGKAGHLVRLAHPFLGRNGSIILYKGSLDSGERASLEEEAGRRSLSISVIPSPVPFLEEVRSLVRITRCST